MISTGEKEFVQALKSIARNEKIKAYIEQSKDLYSLFLRASQRFVTGETRKEAIVKANELLSKEYLVSLEYIGENTTTEEECRKAKDEFIELMKEVDSNGFQSTISFDLSHIGLCMNPDIAFEYLDEIAKEAEQKGLYLMISMEESAKTDQILDIYKRIAKSHSNVGITLQVHLKRSVEDINELLNYQGRIRIVKGAYQEPSEIAYPRSEELDKRYLQFVETCVKANQPISIATHDEKLISQLRELGYLNSPNVEVEMLYGIRPDLIKQLKDDGYKTRVYLTYGEEWYLYLCHRIAEYPPNIYLAVSDIIDPSRTKNSIY
ncbi:proline dehydrogenase family protein [Aneurinibacillus uraniidurans]|uniref:proline dehydrogenase family protein n=1 Tax=Aneurinibacillus uraniidurans TaxID=2966586 RepID=UPI00234ACE16|nr:proline dehydrogenase family protein [Aneurinibacillus sp. B1]WCN37375.1 proline dehydrogenase family protein [Aneurinibacillus sp. B1]